MKALDILLLAIALFIATMVFNTCHSIYENQVKERPPISEQRRIW